MTRSNARDIASRYFVNDLSDAVIPATRLNNVLDNLRNGRQLTTITLNYLHKQGLTALHRLAVGEIAYEAFCELAGAEQTERKKAVEVERLAREAKQKAHEAASAANYERERQLAEQAQRARESDPKHIAKVKNQQLRARYRLDECPRRLKFDPTSISGSVFGRRQQLRSQQASKSRNFGRSL